MAERLADRPLAAARVRVEVGIGRAAAATRGATTARGRRPAEPARAAPRRRTVKGRKGLRTRSLEQLEEPIEPVADIDLASWPGHGQGASSGDLGHRQEPPAGILDGRPDRRTSSGSSIDGPGVHSTRSGSTTVASFITFMTAGYAVAMAGRASLVRAEPGFSLPFFDRLAPAPPPALVAARLETHTGPGDIVLDLHGRGGWIAHAAIDRQRRAVSIESSPLTRLLAELVLRPPDLRHLDAAFQAMSASPRRQSSLKNAIGDLFATRCATCGRMLVADEFIWPGTADATPTTPTTSRARRQALPLPGLPRPARRLRAAHRAARRRGPGAGRQTPRGRRRRPWQALGPLPGRRGRRGARRRACSTSTRPASSSARGDPRAGRGRPAGRADRGGPPARAAPCAAAGEPAERLPGADRDAPDPGRPRPAAGIGRLAGAQPVAGVRGRDPARPRLHPAARGRRARLRPGPARRGRPEPVRRDRERGARRGRAVGGPDPRREGRGPRAPGAPPTAGRVRLVLGQPPVRPNQERSHSRTGRPPGSWVATRLDPPDRGALRRRDPRAVGLAGDRAWPIARSVEPAIARDGRVVFLVDSGGGGGTRRGGARRRGGGLPARPGAARGRRRGRHRHDRTGSARRGRAARAANPRQRRAGPGARRRRRPGHGAGAGLFVGPERFDRRPFSQQDAARTVADVAVETIKARGEPARYERLLGEILVGLDRAGQLRRLLAADGATAEDPADVQDKDPVAMSRAERRPGRSGPTGERRRSEGAAWRRDAPRRRSGPPRRRRGPAPRSPWPRPTRSTASSSSSAPSSPGPTIAASSEIEPGRWWLADREDLGAAAARSPTGSNGPSSASCRLPVPSASPRSSSGSPPCSPATTCPTRRSSGPASRAIGAWPARPTGSSPATTSCVGPSSTPRRSPASPRAATASG